MIECKICGESFLPKNKKAMYCSAYCRLKAYRALETPLLRKYPFVIDKVGNRTKISKELILMLLSEYEKLENTIPIEIVVNKPKIIPKVVEVKKVETIVKPNVKAIVEKPIVTYEMPQKKKVDYRKEFESCELPDEFRLLWEKINEDTSLTPNEKKLWKIEFGIK